MIDKIRDYIEKYHLIERKDMVLLGVSGGADSVCLMQVLLMLKNEMDFSMEVIHVEHGIRGDESKEDARFVEKLCKDKNVPFYLRDVRVPEYAKEHGLGLEEAARILRYQAFAGFAQEYVQQERSVKVALAHHMDDNAETILFQMIRGSGITGLCGMNPMRLDEDGICYIRPLLAVQRTEIETFLEERGIKYRTDSTNLELDYSRNRIRRVILPELLKINSQAVAHMNQTAERMHEVKDFLDAEAVGAEARMTEQRENSVLIHTKEWETLAPAIKKEVIRQALFQAAGRQKDITAVHVKAVMELTQMQSGRKIRLPYGLCARREYDTIRIEPERPPKTDSWEMEISMEMLQEMIQTGRQCEVFAGQTGSSVLLQVRKFTGNIEEIPKNPYTKWLDYDMIKNGFLLRNRRPGDFLYIDRAGHRKKLKEYFVNEKIPLSKRGKMILAAKGAEILCIQEGRVSASCQVTADTGYVLEIIYNGGK